MFAVRQLGLRPLAAGSCKALDLLTPSAKMLLMDEFVFLTLSSHGSLSEYHRSASPEPLTLQRARTSAWRTPVSKRVSVTGCPDAGHLSPFIRTKNWRFENAFRVNPMRSV